jgi:hypothetical protein
MTDSEAWIPRQPAEEPPLPSRVDEVEVVDGLPVLAEVREVTPVTAVRVGAIPAVQAAAAAATGFVAGAATMALARRLAVRRVARMAGFGGRPGSLPTSGRRTYVVHVRVLGRPGE